MNIPLSVLRRMGHGKPSGWYDRTVARGAVAGGVLCMTDEAWAEANAEKVGRPAAAPAPAPPKSRRGLGDVVETLARPVAKALGMDCHDATGELKPGTPCAKRKGKMNQAVPLTKEGLKAKLALYLEAMARRLRRTSKRPRKDPLTGP